MKKITILSFLLVLTSCGFGDKLEMRENIETDLKEYLKTAELNTLINWGTEKNDNYINVNLTNFDFEKNKQNLDSLSKAIRKRIFEKFPESKNVTFIEVNFMAPDTVIKGRKMATFR